MINLMYELYTVFNRILIVHFIISNTNCKAIQNVILTIIKLSLTQKKDLKKEITKNSFSVKIFTTKGKLIKNA